MSTKHTWKYQTHTRTRHSLRALILAIAIFPLAYATSVGTVKGADADYVIVVVFDGFRPDAITDIGPAGLPNVYRMMNEGSWTANARADYEYTETLPNHTDMLTSRPVSGSFGHGVSFNTDIGGTIHDISDSYVTSVFDIVHDNGLRTGLFASKSKFAFFDRSWNADAGRPDPIGADNGRDKIDMYNYNSNTTQLTSTFISAMTSNPFHYAMISLWDPDWVGHTSGWMSEAYLAAVQTVDGYLGQILSMVESSSVLNGHTIVMLMADHGGTGGGHATATDPLNYTIPFLVWGPGVTAGGDLYVLNPDTRIDPGDSRPDNTAEPQPIRSGDAANLATQLLGLGVVDGSLFNSSHELSDTFSPYSEGI